MAPRTFLTTFVLTAAMAVPAMAADAQRRRPQNDDSQARQAGRPTEQAAPREQRTAPREQRTAPPEQRTAPRAAEQPRAPQQNQGVPQQSQRTQQDRRAQQNSREQQTTRGSAVPRQYDTRQYDTRQYDTRQYDTRRSDNNRYDNRGYSSGRYAPRIIRPSIVRVIPYRPYVYRPSYSIGVYYGSDGYYPYGATPRGYYDPIPGRYYGGVRITGAPRDAQVFADGYYVGLVNDFDGIFQHVNLEAGAHHIEIEWGGYEPIAFDVYVRPGETTTFRADGYFGRY
jgi:hypothetical protein